MGVRIESQEHLSLGAVAELRHLCRRQMGSEGAGSIGKACLPKHGYIERTFHNNQLREVPDELPGEPATFGPRQEAMWWSHVNTAAIKIDHLARRWAREHHPAIEGVSPQLVHQSGVAQKSRPEAQPAQLTPQVSAGCIANAQLTDAFRIA